MSSVNSVNSTYDNKWIPWLQQNNQEDNSVPTATEAPKVSYTTGEFGTVTAPTYVDPSTRVEPTTGIHTWGSSGSVQNEDGVSISTGSSQGYGLAYVNPDELESYGATKMLIA